MGGEERREREGDKIRVSWTGKSIEGKVSNSHWKTSNEDEEDLKMYVEGHWKVVTLRRRVGV